MFKSAKSVIWKNRNPIATVIGSTIVIAIGMIGYGIKLSKTYPPEFDPKHIEKDIANDGAKYVLTSDNRIVEYFIYGSTKQNASVIIEIAGGISSGQFLAKGGVKGLKEFYISHNIRGISITLPGWGYSSLNPKRKYVDWPSTDLQPILDAENVGKFTISGISLGSPHAMSVAYYYKDRITALGIRVPFLGLPLSDEEGLPIGQPSFSSDAIFGTGGTWWYSWAVHLSFKFFTILMTKQSFYKYLLPSKLWKDYPELTQSAVNDLIRAQKYSGYHGLLQCMAHETILEWGFDVRELKEIISKLVVWYCEDDDDCPPQHGEWIANYFKQNNDIKMNVRVSNGYGHIGGCLDHIEYTKALISV